MVYIFAPLRVDADFKTMITCSVIALMASGIATLCVDVGYRARLLRRTPGASLAPPARLVDFSP